MEEQKTTNVTGSQPGPSTMIKVGGVEYPAYLTNGALLRFKQKTGRDLEHSDGGFSDTFTLVWCCVVSACKREGRHFDLSLEDFADATSPADIESWSEGMFSGSTTDESDGAKKKAE